MVDPFASAIDEALFLRAKLIMVLTAFMSFMLLDFLICLPAELRYIFYPEAKALLKSDLPKRGRVSVPTLLLLVARCLSPIMFALTIAIVIGQPSSCAAVFRTIALLYSISSANGSAVFIIRTVAVRDSGRPLKVVLWAVWILQFAVWLYWSVKSYIDQIPAEDQYTLTCQPGSFPNWTWALYLEAFIFDSIILMLTLRGHFQNVKQTLLPGSIRDTNITRSNVSKIFFQDTLMYFALSVVVTLCVMAWSYTYRHDQITALIVFPIHIWLNLTIPPRVLRSLKLHSAKEERRVTVGPNTTTCSSCEARMLSNGYHNSDQRQESGISVDMEKVVSVSTPSTGNPAILYPDDEPPFQHAVTPVLN